MTINEMTINELINQIPQVTTDEALFSINTITTCNYTKSAQIVCHLTNKFIVNVQIKKKSVVISSGENNKLWCTASNFVSQLKRMIYNVDEQICNGNYVYKKKPVFDKYSIPTCSPPLYMDIPVWCTESGKWYDAEY